MRRGRAGAESTIDTKPIKGTDAATQRRFGAMGETPPDTPLCDPNTCASDSLSQGVITKVINSNTKSLN